MRMVPVLDILRKTTYSVDFGDVDSYGAPENFWRKMIHHKSMDTGFGHLVESILKNGWSENSAIGWKCWGDDTYEITEGHHRLVAAILLGLDEIPVMPWGQSDRLGIDAHGFEAVDIDGNPVDEYPIEVEVW